MLDTNVIIDLFSDKDTPEAEWSRATYRDLSAEERFGCNLIVVAELAAEGETPEILNARLDRFHIEVVDMSADVAYAAGRAHRAYRGRGGARQTILPDFLVAGHASVLNAGLMTRDRRLAGYFPDLTLITPETDNG